jgi:hypothetical protein
MVERRVGRNLVEPGPVVRIPIQPVEGSIRSKESLLAEVLGFAAISRQSHDVRKDLGVMPLDQLLESRDLGHVLTLSAATISHSTRTRDRATCEIRPELPVGTANLGRQGYTQPPFGGKMPELAIEPAGTGMMRTMLVDAKHGITTTGTSNEGSFAVPAGPIRRPSPRTRTTPACVGVNGGCG